MSYASLICVLLVCVSVKQTTASCKPCNCASYLYDKLLKSTCSFRQIDQILPNIPVNMPPNITYLEMNDQPLKSLTARMYVRAKLSQLKKLEHDECIIATVDKDAFSGMLALEQLLLERNQIKSLDRKVFSTNINLTSVSLKRNQLAILPNGLFSNLTSLTSVDLTYNTIQYVEEYAFYNNPSLVKIDLQDNQLRVIEASMVDRLKALTHLLIHGNDWYCNCGQAKLRDLMAERYMFYRTNPRCANPQSVRYKNWDALKADDFKCWLRMYKPVNQNENITEYGDYADLSCEFGANPIITHIEWHYQADDAPKENDKKYYISSSFDKSYLNNYTTLRIRDVTPADSGKYTCKGITDNGNLTGTYYLTVITTQPARVTVLSEPSIEVTEYDENVTLPCKIFGIPKPTMQWLANRDTVKSEGNIILTQSPAETDHYWYNLTFKTIREENWKNYTCSGWTRKGDMLQTVSITVKLAPKAAIYGTEGDGKTFATIFCRAKAYPQPTFKWQLNDVDIDTSSRKYSTTTTAGNDSPSYFKAYLRITDLSIPDEGTYKCIATNEVGHSSADTYLRYDHIPVIHIPADNTVIAATPSGTVTLECKSTGRPSDIFWVRNGKDLTKSSGKYLLKRNYGDIAWCNLTIFDTDSSDGGTYQCVATNDLGFVNRIVVLKVTGEVGGVSIAIWIILVLLVVIALVAIFIWKYCKRPQHCTQTQAVTQMPEDQVQFTVNGYDNNVVQESQEQDRTQLPTDENPICENNSTYRRRNSDDMSQQAIL